MKRSRYEQETVINYNEAEATASIYTHDPKLIQKLTRLAEKYLHKINREREYNFTVPKSYALVREPYSDERRAAARAWAKLSGTTPPPRSPRSRT